MNIKSLVLAGALYLSANESYCADKIDLPKFGKIDMSSKIIPNGHFTWAEATENGTILPKSTEIVENIVKAAQNMEEIRKYLGNKPITINSWYRNPEANNAAGGVKDSRHLHGDAIDFVVQGVNPSDAYSKLDTYWNARGGLGKYHGFTHIDSRGKRARWSGN